MLYRKPRSKIEIVNDINSDLVNLHRVIRNHPQTLSLYLNEMLISREVFYDLREARLLPKNDIERAAHYFFMLSQSFGSKARAFAMPKSRAPKDIYRAFKIFSDRLKGVCIENMDFSRLIQHYDRETTLFYLDPPCVGTEDYYQGQSFGLKDHEKLSSMLREIRGRFVLSYNDCDIVRDLYRHFAIEEVTVRYSLNGAIQKEGNELIISN